MQKTLALLEKNVEWIALALGGLFVLYCAYAYVYTPPATVRVGTQMLGPGEVSDFTNKLVKDMKHQIADTSNFKPIDVPQVLTAWKTQMGVPAPAPAIPQWAINSFVSTGVVQDINRDRTKGSFHVDVLAQLPEAQLQAVQSGLSNVALPAPANPGGNAQPIANAVLEDLTWVSVSAVIPARQLQDAFAAPLAGQDPNNPQVAHDVEALYRTSFLQIELQRQRATGQANGQPVFPPGNQGVETVAAPRIQKDDLEPMPDAKANSPAKAEFIHWAEGHLDVITQPKFYEVKAGDIWNSPAAPAGAKPAPGALALRPGLPPVNPPPMAIPNPNAMPGANAAPGVINPLNIPADFTVWAHDETAKPGETYRYRLVYHMKNPVVDIKNIAGPKIINVLDIASPPSAWSQPVTIARKIMFWVSSVNRNGTVQMDVFQYSQGQWQKTTTTPLWPGDQVPQTEVAIIDVHAGTTMRDKYILVADAEGDIKKHPASERNDSKYKEMLDLVNKPVTPAAAPGRTPPAPPPPSGRRTASVRGG
jgi:hypothetical protein